jgi:hypothetical protein
MGTGEKTTIKQARVFYTGFVKVALLYLLAKHRWEKRM